jgi:hypothetical protein
VALRVCRTDHDFVNAIKSLWAMVQGNPVFMRRVNGWLTVFWIVMIPVSILTGWVQSVVYVSALSLWALVSGHWSAWQAARVEVKEDMASQRDRQARASARWREAARTTQRRPSRYLRARAGRSGPPTNNSRRPSHHHESA